MDRWQEDILERARELLPAPVHRYFVQGADRGVSAAEATQAWSRLRLWPHVLRDVSTVDISTTVLGERLPTPLGIASTSMQGYVHPDGEVAMARAAAASDTLLVVPSNAGASFADIGATGARWWLQVYATADRSLIEPVVRRAVDAGASALALTVDTPVVSTRYGAEDPAWAEVTEPPRRTNHEPGSRRPGAPGAAHARDLTPADLEWLARVGGVPVLAKGVLRPGDARRCVDAGAQAVWVSNHGGRQLDRAVSTATALPAVAAEVTAEAEVYVDGGIRHGLDTMAALAAGADLVLLGRLPLLSLAVGGEELVVTCLERLRTELVEALMLAGCADVGATRDLLDPEDGDGAQEAPTPRRRRDDQAPSGR